MEVSPQKDIIALVVLLLFILAGAGYWYANSLPGIFAPSAAQKPQLNPTVREISYTSNRAAPLVVHQSKSGTVYTYSGSIPSRATCESIASGISTNKSGTTINVTLNLRLLYAGGNCASATSSTPPQKFSFSYTASKGANIKLVGVNINEAPVPFTVK